MSATTDYEGDKALAKKLLAEADAEKIALALRRAWHDGLRAGKLHRLLTATALCLAMSPAIAAPKIVNDIPQAMRGEWCYSKSREAARVNTSIYVKGKCEQEEKWEKDANTTDGDVTLDSMRFDGWEFGCNVNRIREVIRDKSYTLEMKCGGEGNIWSERTNFHLASDTVLVHKTEWTSTPRPEK